jgi:hypothetical protein
MHCRLRMLCRKTTTTSTTVKCELNKNGLGLNWKNLSALGGSRKA